MSFLTFDNSRLAITPGQKRRKLTMLKFIQTTTGRYVADRLIGWIEQDQKTGNWRLLDDKGEFLADAKQDEIQPGRWGTAITVYDGNL